MTRPVQLARTSNYKTSPANSVVFASSFHIYDVKDKKQCRSMSRLSGSVVNVYKMTCAEAERWVYKPVNIDLFLSLIYISTFAVIPKTKCL